MEFFRMVLKILAMLYLIWGYLVISYCDRIWSEEFEFI